MTVRLYRSSDAGAISDNLICGNGNSNLVTILKGVLVNGYSDNSKPGAGWSNPYDDAINGVTVIENSQGNLYQVDEETIYAAKVQGFESMTDPYTGVKGRWTNDSFFWHVGENVSSDNYEWVIIADDKMFLMCTRIKNVGTDCVIFGVAELDGGLLNNTDVIIGSSTSSNQSSVNVTSFHLNVTNMCSIHNDGVSSNASIGKMMFGASSAIGGSTSNGQHRYNDGLLYKEVVFGNSNDKTIGKVRSLLEPLGIFANIVNKPSYITNIVGYDTYKFHVFDGLDDLLGKKVCLVHGLTNNNNHWSCLLVADQ